MVKKTAPVFIDRLGRPIIPESVRAKISGNVFLCFDAKDIPPAGARVEVRVKAVVMPPHLDATGEDGMGPYVAIVPFKAESVRNLVIVIPEPVPSEQATVDEAIAAGNGKSSPARSAARAKAATRRR